LFVSLFVIESVNQFSNNGASSPISFVDGVVCLFVIKPVNQLSNNAASSPISSVDCVFVYLFVSSLLRE